MADLKSGARVRQCEIERQMCSTIRFLYSCFYELFFVKFNWLPWDQNNHVSSFICFISTYAHIVRRPHRLKTLFQKPLSGLSGPLSILLSSIWKSYSSPEKWNSIAHSGPVYEPLQRGTFLYNKVPKVLHDYFFKMYTTASSLTQIPLSILHVIIHNLCSMCQIKIFSLARTWLAESFIVF